MSGKPEKWQGKQFNPGNSDHVTVIETIEEYVGRQERVNSNDKLIKEIKPILRDKGIEYSSNYLVKLLAEGGREYLRERGKIEIVTEPRGGNPAKVYQKIAEK